MIGLTLCSGIGAPEAAAPWVDWRFAAEIEPFPRAVLQQRFGYKTPEDHNQGEPLLWSDMTEASPDLLRSRGVPLPDLVVAGTPCQAFSVAGARKGLADARGNLTLKFVEILHAIVAARPDGKLAVLWENVPGVLSDKGNAFGCFLGGLVGALDALPAPDGGTWPSEGMVEGPRARLAWAVLDAQWFGVAQRRRRVFVVVDFGGAIDPAAVLLEPDRLRGDHPPRRETGQGSARGIEIGPSGGSFTDVNPTLDTRAKDGPVRNQLAGAVLTFDRQSSGEYGEALIASTISARDYKGAADLVAFDCKGTEVQFSTDGSHLTLRSMGHNKSHQNAGGHAAVAFAIQERAASENPNAGPDGAGFRGDGAAYTLEARTVTQAVAFQPGNLKRGCGANPSTQVFPTLAANHGRGASDQEPHIATPWAVRRLTATECERLQGFPDGHTEIAWRGKAPADCPDGPRYKALGNSMAVPCIKWILDRIKISADIERRIAA